jgi:hypothetical protein
MVADRHPERGRHLVVAAPPGVEARAEVTEATRHLGLDGGVDVLGVARHPLPGHEVGVHFAERGFELGRFLPAEDAAAGERGGPRRRGDEVGGRERHVLMQRVGDLPQRRVHGGVESAAPQVRRPRGRHRFGSSSNHFSVPDRRCQVR